MQPVRKYIAHVDADYKRNKVTVCANLSNIYNTFIVRNGRPGPTVNNFFDIDKWLAKFGQIEEAAKQGAEKDLKRMNTVGNLNEEKSGLTKQDSLVNKEGQVHQKSLLLPKSLSTQHIPQQARNKYSKRVYANYDKENAIRMFGYRAIFSRGRMSIKVPDPYASQKHKPLERYVNDIVNELNSQYVAIPKYCTRRKLLIPILDEDEDEDSKDQSIQFVKQEDAFGDDEDYVDGDKQLSQTIKPKNATFRSSCATKKILKVGGEDGQTYQKRVKMLYWNYDHRHRNFSSS